MWMIPGHSIPMAVSFLDEGGGARPLCRVPPQPGWGTGIDRPGRLTPEYEVRWFHFGRGGARRAGGLLVEFRTRPAASSFLCRFRIDSAAMATLRGVLAAVSVTSAIHRLRDDAVLEQLAECLVAGAVVVAVELGLRPHDVSALAPPRAALREPRLALRPPPRHAPYAPPLPAAPDPLLPDRAVAGCDCLREASEHGIPFILMGTH